MDKGALRTTGGWRLPDNFGLVEVYGEDAGRFLQGQTTNDVLALAPGNCQLSAILDRRAHVLFVFHLFRKHTSYRILIEKDYIAPLLEHLEKFKFADKVEFLDLSHSGKFISVEGRKSRKAILKLVDGKPRLDLFDKTLSDLHCHNCQVHMFKFSETGEDGFFFFATATEFEQFFKTLKAACESVGMREISEEEVNIARVESGFPRWGVDFGEENLLPEIGLEEIAVSYTKGCYVGQEVLARLKAQGAVTRAFVGLLFPEGSKKSYASGTTINLAGKEAALLKSNVYSPLMKRAIGFASIKRDYRVPGTALDVEIEGEQKKILVNKIPFYVPLSPHESADRLLEEALSLYASEDDTRYDGVAPYKDSPAVEKLREAIELNPGLESAYEVLGVILSKRDRLDEAIEMMKKLAAMNPDSVMAHANLSVFYMNKGLKEEAEEEKAVSMSITMRKLAAEAMAAEKEKVDTETQKKEAKERMEMFAQVLEIDPEDQLANFGMGSCHNLLGEFDKAIPCLKQSIKAQPNHGPSYLELGKALEGAKEISQAVDVYREGMEVAGRRGQMEPYKAMEERLRVLQVNAS